MLLTFQTWGFVSLTANYEDRGSSSFTLSLIAQTLQSVLLEAGCVYMSCRSYKELSWSNGMI